jgi:hypothetical protein
MKVIKYYCDFCFRETSGTSPYPCQLCLDFLIWNYQEQKKYNEYTFFGCKIKIPHAFDSATASGHLIYTYKGLKTLARKSLI